MKSHSKKNYIYENDILVYESLIDEFTSNVFKDFDSRFNKLDIISRITRLISGEIVNESEGQAALHTKYRSSSRPEYLLKEQNKAKEFLRRHTKECINNNYKEINIITLGIDLNKTINNTIQINNVIFKIHKLCQPCKYLQNKLEVKNLVKLLAFKSGVRAEILMSGEISINDQIKIIK